MDLINRYVYAVTKSLPEKQREDIEKELRTLIDDMIDQNQENEDYNSKAQKVLMELGDPEALADNYRGSKRYIIGPQYYEKYLLILKIVLGAVFIGITVAVFFDSIYSVERNAFDLVLGYANSLFYGLLQAFGWTTIAFMLAERNNLNVNKKESSLRKWDPSLLPLIPQKKSKIPMSEPIVSILFSTIFIALLYSAPNLFAAYISNNNNMIVIPVFNMEVIQGYRALFLGVFVLGILKDALKLYYKSWTLKLSILVSGLSVAITVLVAIIFSNNNIWNVDFSYQIVNNMNLTFDFTSIWSNFTSFFVKAVILFSVIDIFSTLYKGMKYGTPK